MTVDKPDALDPSSVITVGKIVTTVKVLAATVVALGVLGAAWVAVGLPVPATKRFVNGHVVQLASSQADANSRIDNLAKFAQQTRSIILRQDRRDVQAEIDRYHEDEATPQIKRLIEALEDDVRAIEEQIEDLEQ